MGKSIRDYEKKRDFGRTPEPPAKRERPRDAADEPVFVVHRHDARRLHYDLRLEMEGVLRSWAVPKGFSYDPNDKHLAVRTEDHPLEYEDFHGVIPKGEYGAGTMTIWDRGHYRVVHADSGPQAVDDGELKVILSGRKLRGEWHLVRTKDGENNWLLFKSRDRYAAHGRDTAVGIDLSQAKEGKLPRTLKPMEIGGRAKPFSDPEWMFEARFAGRRLLAEKRGDAVRLRGLKTRIPALEKELGAIRAENALMDGVLVALDDSERPSRDLLEKALASKERAGLTFYVFDLLYYEEFDLRALPLIDRKAALRAVLPPLESLLYLDHVPGNGEQLVEAVAAAGLPGVVAKRGGAPYRPGPSDDWREIPVKPKARRKALPVSAALSTKNKRKAGGGKKGGRVRCTNLAKVFWPAEGFTKGDLLGYYERVSDVLLPYLRERPVHMNRFPDGIEGKSFYQKEIKPDAPDWIDTIPIESGTKGAAVPYMICNDRDSLLYLINLGSIDLHPWMSRRGSLESPDYAVVDLDPKEAPFSDVIMIARVVGEILHAVGLRPLLKTSGATGLHIVIPLEPGYTYEQARMFCEGVARVVVRRLPDIATVERVVGQREGKVYVDFGQNAEGQTVVPPYVVRPVRGATVSTPLYWEELDDGLHPSLFTIQTVPPRIEEHGDLFAPMLDDPQNLLPAIEALPGLLGG